jgi:hypothetical protein
VVLLHFLNTLSTQQPDEIKINGSFSIHPGYLFNAKWVKSNSKYKSYPMQKKTLRQNKIKISDAKSAVIALEIPDKAGLLK